MIFSPNIIPLLCKFKMKLSIIHPPEKFMRTVSQKIKPEKINTLRLEARHVEQTMKLASSNTFKNVKSLTIDNLEKKTKIYYIKKYIPSPIHLSTHYENEVNFHTLSKIFKLISNSVKRLETHCDSIHCSHYRTDFVFTGISDLNTSVEYFVLNVGHTSLSIVNKCRQYHPKCELRTITDFIKIMSNIRYIRIIINTGYAETLLDTNEWATLVTLCNKLEKITLKVITNMSKDTQLAENIRVIDNELHTIRPSIKFEVKVK